ncbi:MAG TPA: hypothetical protein P5543_11550 [Planctomycetota bacterium]|nr:hypothetical protein [Planctomycetota bacterium]
MSCFGRYFGNLLWGVILVICSGALFCSGELSCSGELDLLWGVELLWALFW